MRVQDEAMRGNEVTGKWVFRRELAALQDFTSRSMFGTVSARPHDPAAGRESARSKKIAVAVTAHAGLYAPPP